jgi:hypothetical protein
MHSFCQLIPLELGEGCKHGRSVKRMDEKKAAKAAIFVTRWKIPTLCFQPSKLGWLMGLEPTTTGITILDSTN